MICELPCCRSEISGCVHSPGLPSLARGPTVVCCCSSRLSGRLDSLPQGHARRSLASLIRSGCGKSVLCCPASDAALRESPTPQRRGLRPLIVQICNCQNCAPPACTSLRCIRVTHTTARGLPPEAEIVDHFAAVGGRVFLLPLKDLLYGGTETAMALDGVLPPKS